jgi:CMP-N,N'-diacetyllegionaminic acid synthase
MLDKRKVIAVIPARSGSRRLKNKNIKLFCGRPLIYWTIDEALKSNYIDKVIVSSESDEMLAVVESNFPDITRKRKKELATDDAKVVNVLSDMLKQDEFQSYDIVIILQPTSPLRTVENIDGALSEWNLNESGPLISISSVGMPELFSLQDGNKINKVSLEKSNHDCLYKANGAIYIMSSNEIRKKEIIDIARSRGYMMANNKSFDIDNLDDFETAEAVMVKFQPSRIAEHINEEYCYSEIS